MTPTHALLPSLDALLDRAFLAEIEGRVPRDVRRKPFHSLDSLSGSRFLAVETVGADGRCRRYVVKRIALAWDWIMRATGDTHGRAAVSWSSGLLDRLPPEISAEVVGVARDGEGWALLLRDVSPHLVPSGDDPITPEDHLTFLTAMTALHATFWERHDAADPAQGFCSLEQRYAEFVPAVAERERGGDDPIPPMIGRGWEALWTLLDPALVASLQALLADTRPLIDALRRLPQTVIHGDWKLGNLGILPERDGRRQVVLLDWAVVGPAPAAVDLAWYLAVNCVRLPISKEASILAYRDALLARLALTAEPEWWQPSLDLALLGALLQLGWVKGVSAVEGQSDAARARELDEIAWWADRARRALPLLA